MRRIKPILRRGKSWVYDSRGLPVTLSDARTGKTLGHFHSRADARDAGEQYRRRTGKSFAIFPSQRGRDPNEDDKIDEIARGMLNRYSTPKVAAEMAWHHAMDYWTSTENDERFLRWKAVSKRIEQLARERGRK